MANVGVISLGCAKNLVDTERMLGLVKAAGHTIVSSPARADALIVNTCGFIEPAKQESIDTILEMARYKKTGRCQKLIVTGCLAERYRAELTEAMPEIDALLGVREYEKLPRLLDETANEPAPCSPYTKRVLTTPPYRAYLRIADGCNNRCAYCAIPLIRGKLVSEPIEAILDEAKRLADAGVTELTLIAQDTSGYGVDRYGQPRLCELLERVSRIDGVHWVRVLYTYPDTVTPALIDRISGNDKIASYLDMPLQHTEDEILSRMHRRGDRRHIIDVLDYVAQHAPDFMLRTTLMVGFPGETDAQFERMRAFLVEHPFDRVGAFAFSAEEGTTAADLPNQVPENVKAARFDALMETQRRVSRMRGEARVGKTVETLVEGYTQGRAYGRSYAEAPDADGRILFDVGSAHPKAGEYVPVLLTQAADYDMSGRMQA